MTQPLSDEVGGARNDPVLAPGAVLSGRYRIVSLIGRGGMGEVYRADDLRLGLPVALKFLPARIAADPTRVEQLLGEVRVGRRITHPNVCRIHDVGELAGRPFLSMEYIDGEDLASLLRRVGRLAPERVLYIAAHLIAGLAAAHDRGVIHRDLKPANVMIDGRGIAHIMDFGLAITERDAEHGIAGTPAYMAPEQFQSGRVTPRTDIYALGLMLYEMSTGHRVFEGRSTEQILRAHGQPKVPPSILVREIDTDLSAAILQCLEEDPEARPRRVRDVADALHVGDALTAAVAAGDTPAPELLVAAEREPLLSSSMVWLLLAGSLIGIIAVAALYDRVSLLGRLGLPVPPEALQEKARAVAALGGHSAFPVDDARGFVVEGMILAELREARPSDGAPAGTRPDAIRFWYRQGVQPLKPWNASGIVTGADPPWSEPGMVFVTLDRYGRLESFRAVPARYSASAPRAVEWQGWFEAAGLQPEKFRSVGSVRTPPGPFDQRRAWIGTIDGHTPVRVEAASLAGKTVWFAVLHRWSESSTDWRPAAWWATVSQWLYVALYVALVVFALAVVRRHARRGRAAYRHAGILAASTCSTQILARLIMADHVPVLATEFRVLTSILAMSVFYGAQLGLAYLAAEPYVRRNWPEMLVPLAKLLDGRVRDPLVARDALIGLSAAVVIIVTFGTAFLASELIDGNPRLVEIPAVWRLATPRYLVAMVFARQSTALFNALGMLLALFLLARVFRRYAVAAAVLTLIVATAYTNWTTGWVLAEWTMSAAATALVVWLLHRFGVLALAFCYSFGWMIAALPLTLRSSVWYAGQAFFAFLCIAVIGVVAALGVKRRAYSVNAWSNSVETVRQGRP